VAEAAAHVEHMHGDLIGIDAGDLADIVLDEARDLGAGPYLGASSSTRTMALIGSSGAWAR
jgi:hypothetical protein